MFDKQNDSGVSPVIGVILMVAVTVALVALVTVTVFDLGGDVSESPDATVQLEETDGQEVQATLLRNENVDRLYLNYSGDGGPSVDSGNTSNILENAGDTIETGATGNDYQSLTDSGSLPKTVNVIAVMPDGNEEVLTSTTVE